MGKARKPNFPSRTKRAGSKKRTAADPMVVKVQRQIRLRNANQSSGQLKGIKVKKITNREKIKTRHMPNFGEANRIMNSLKWLANIRIGSVNALIEFTPMEGKIEVHKMQTADGKRKIELTEESTKKWVLTKLRQLCKRDERNAELGSTDWLEGW